MTAEKATVNDSLSENTRSPNSRPSVTGGRVMATTKRLATLLAVVAGLTGCGIERGDPVESNFAKPDPVELAFIEPVATDDVENPLSDYEVVEVVRDEPTPGIFAFDARDAFTGELVQGGKLFAGEPMIIAFVTPTCPICVDEAPKLATSASLNPDVNYVVVHSGGETEQYQEYAEQSKLAGDNITHLVDGGTELWAWFGVLAQPSYVLVDARGSVLSSVGALQDHGLARAVELITAESG